MRKRAVAGFLWFYSMWYAYELVWSMTGVPRQIGPIVGFLVAALVVVDPTGIFWGRRITVNVAPLSQPVAES